MFSLDKGTGLYHNFAMRLAVPFLVVLLAALSAAADGFVISTNAIPSERRAALEALCARIEACGLPKLPRGAEWTDAFDSGRSLPHEEFYFGGWVRSFGYSWRIKHNEETGLSEVIDTAGRRYLFSSSDIHSARITRDAAAIAIALLNDAEESKKVKGDEDDDDDMLMEDRRLSAIDKKVGCVLVFAVQLFRAGYEAEANAIISALEQARGLESAERDARHTLYAD